MERRLDSDRTFQTYDLYFLSLVLFLLQRSDSSFPIFHTVIASNLLPIYLSMFLLFYRSVSFISARLLNGRNEENQYEAADRFCNEERR